jgi:hypothetical protein
MKICFVIYGGPGRRKRFFHRNLGFLIENFKFLSKNWIRQAFLFYLPDPDQPEYLVIKMIVTLNLTILSTVLIQIYSFPYLTLPYPRKNLKFQTLPYPTLEKI